MEEVGKSINAAQSKMDKVLEHLDFMLAQIRAGRASTRILDSVMVDYYGSPTPLSQVANVSTPDARTITIQPWEKTLFAAIERAIMQANLGLNPENNGEVIRINVPMPTEERRKELVKQAKAEAEDAKVGIRNARRDCNEQIKKLTKEGLSEDLGKDAEAKMQKVTDQYSKKIDEIIAQKEAEIMTV